MLRFDQIVSAVLASRMPGNDYVTHSELRSSRRIRAHIEARTLICVLAFQFMRAPSSPKIGRLLDRDHTSVLHMVKNFERHRTYYNHAYQEICLKLAGVDAEKLSAFRSAILTLREIAA